MPGPYSDEVKSIIAFVDAAGVPYRVTDINTSGVHTTTSYHYAQGTGGVGLAVDFAGSTPGTSTAMVAQMTAIWRLFRPVAPKLAELFFQTPDILMCVKNGAWRPGLQTLGATTWNAHRNHVHVAVKRGVLLTPAPAHQAAAAATPAPMVPAPVHDYEEGATKTVMMHIGPLDPNGCGHASWDPGLGRDPVVVAATLHGPYPPADGYWMQQADVTLAAQPRGGTVAVTVRNGKSGDTVTAWVTVA